MPKATARKSGPREVPNIAPETPRKLSAPIYRGRIPRVEGPKLDEFPHRKAAINFRALLSDPDGEGEAHVFDVEILSQTFALKIFKFYDDEEDEEGLWPSQKEIVSLDELHAHSDPFYNECRAYGRLKEKNIDGVVAVRCHGYTTVSPTIEAELEERFRVSEWGREDYDKPVAKRAVFRAIVKDLIRDDPPLTPRRVQRMKKDLKSIRAQEIYPCDIQARNYKGGKLVDFSSAMTDPHYLFEIKPAWRVRAFKNKDLFQFDNMVEDEKVKTTIRMTPKEESLRQLRSRDYLQKEYGWSQQELFHLCSKATCRHHGGGKCVILGRVPMTVKR